MTTVSSQGSAGRFGESTGGGAHSPATTFIALDARCPIDRGDSALRTSVSLAPPVPPTTTAPPPDTRAPALLLRGCTRFCDRTSPRERADDRERCLHGCPQPPLPRPATSSSRPGSIRDRLRCRATRPVASRAGAVRRLLGR